jgi:hypothetical protein
VPISKKETFSKTKTNKKINLYQLRVNVKAVWYSPLKGE